MTDTPEITRLREQSWQEEYDTPGGPRKHPPVVDLDDAIQAVRDTEDRKDREREEAVRATDQGTFHRMVGVGRREMAREIVDALREVGDRLLAPSYLAAADHVERTFLNGQVMDDKERAHNVPFHDYNCPVCAERNTDAPS